MLLKARFSFLAPNAGDGGFDLFLEAPDQLANAVNRFPLALNLGHGRMLARIKSGACDWNPIRDPLH